MTGVNHCPPAEPMFVIVQDAPFISAGANLPSRAFVASSLISLDTSKIALRSAFSQLEQASLFQYQLQFRCCSNAFEQLHLFYHR